MALKRAFYNSLLLSDSNVFIAGGMDYPVIFSDISVPLVQPKLWNSTSKKLTILEAMSIPQTDPSIALLLVDGTVFCWKRETLLLNRLHEQSFLCRDLRSRVPFQQQRLCSLKRRPKIQSVSPATSVAVGGKIIINTDYPRKELFICTHRIRHTLCEYRS